ncbi:cysteine desulfurase [Candidatus Nomurabacteria bacterium]|nr:cysteine desulfurase [Candidatus Nomurabacteria bacterium]
MPKINNKKIFLDYAASASPNPGSIHELGIIAKKKLEGARKEVSGVLGSRAEEIIFTSGGTEGNNLAIQGIIYLTPSPLSLIRRGVGERSLPHIVTTNIEHPSVLETCKLLQIRKLAQISIVPVEANGIVDPRKIKKEIKKNTVLVSIMYANNEIGTIQPLREIAKEIRHYRKQNKTNYPYLHTDAVQAVNYLDLNVERLGVDMLTLSGSKIKGAGKVGVLYKRKSVPLVNIFGGGDQEGGLRPGTENLAEILKFSGALTLVQKNKEKETKRLTKLRDYFLRVLDTRLSGVQHLMNGDLENRLPNNVNITFPKIPSDLLVIELSARGIMASSKSACKSSSSEGSYVIKALRPDADPEIGGLRFSLGTDTKKQDINYTIESLSKILTKLKKWYY